MQGQLNIFNTVEAIIHYMVLTEHPSEGTYIYANVTLGEFGP